jgi:hypothetical protein
MRGNAGRFARVCHLKFKLWHVRAKTQTAIKTSFTEGLTTQRESFNIWWKSIFWILVEEENGERTRMNSAFETIYSNFSDLYVLILNSIRNFLNSSSDFQDSNFSKFSSQLPSPKFHLHQNHLKWKLKIWQLKIASITNCLEKVFRIFPFNEGKCFHIRNGWV